MEEYKKLENKIEKIYRELCCIKKGIEGTMYFVRTYNEVLTLLQNNHLVPDALYLISNRGDDGILIYCNNGNGIIITSVGYWGYGNSTWSKLN